MPVKVSVTCDRGFDGGGDRVVVGASGGDAADKDEGGDGYQSETSEIQSYLIKLPGFRKDSSE